MEHSYHYAIKNPDLKNTGYIVAMANLQDKHDRSTPSHFHWKILKCRMIIFSNSSILACPDKQDVKQVHIIFNKVGDDYDKLNSLFIKFSLRQDGAIRSTTPEIFQMCFAYTLMAKIAPTWNVLGYNYLINNRDFLTTDGMQEGVKYQISSDESHTELDLKPVNINLIKATEDIAPGEYVRVLPSLNKAVVEECSKYLPEVGSFRSYKDIRRHWKNIMEHSYHYAIKNPDLKNTGYIVAMANLQDKHDRSTPSHFHWKILKCRMIIFSNSSILACPDKQDVKQVHIIFNKVGDDYDKLNSLFIKFSLRQDGAIRSTTPEIFQMCFAYTLMAKIAPTWNVLGYNYLINNRDFLTTDGMQEGVKYQISSDESHTELDLKPVNINLIKATEDIAPGEYVRVLPSLNKAVVEECSKYLPEVGSFRSYKDIRRHWKNIHGYRLPDEETSYYMIRFWRGEPLTYPDICVTRHFPIITPMPRPREDVVLSRFVSCLKNKIPHFLGIPLTIKIKNSMELCKVNEGRTPVPPTQDHPISLCTPTQKFRPY